MCTNGVFRPAAPASIIQAFAAGFAAALRKSRCACRTSNVHWRNGQIDHSHVTQSVYDAFNELVWQQDADGDVTQYVYDNDGNVIVPDRIVVAHFPKLTLYEFCLEKAPFPEFLKVLEKDVPGRILRCTCSQNNAVRSVSLACGRHLFPIS